MTHHKKFKHESQDARRHDQHNETHPDAKDKKGHAKVDHNHDKKK